MNISEVKKDWKKRGFPPQLWNDPPGQCWEGYVHETDELLMVVEGKYELEIDGKKSIPEIGDEIFIPANVRHSVRNIGKTPAKFLYAYRKK